MLILHLLWSDPAWSGLGKEVRASLYHLLADKIASGPGLAALHLPCGRNLPIPACWNLPIPACPFLPAGWPPPEKNLLERTLLGFLWDCSSLSTDVERKLKCILLALIPCKRKVTTGKKSFQIGALHTHDPGQLYPVHPWRAEHNLGSSAGTEPCRLPLFPSGYPELCCAGNEVCSMESMEKRKIEALSSKPHTSGCSGHKISNLWWAPSHPPQFVVL